VLTSGVSLGIKLPKALMSVTASVSLKRTNNIGKYLSILSRTPSVSWLIVEALLQVKLKMSSTEGYWGAISVKGDKSSIRNNSKAPSGWLTMVKSVCNTKSVVSGGL
jgi:hypothetical protein